MGPHRSGAHPHRHLIVLAVLALALALGLALALFPSNTRGAGEDASFTAIDFAWEVTGNPGENSATIPVGGTVAFEYPTGSSFHNAHFSPAPTSCTQLSGTNSGSVPPLPANPTASSWSGNCTFATEGTYQLFCDAHGFMQGTIVVGDGGPTPPTGGGPGPGPGTPGGGSGTPPTAPAVNTFDGLKLAKTQRSKKPRGSVTVAIAGSNFTATALIKKTRVGRFTKSSAAAGKLDFSIALNRKAKAALAKRGKLALKIEFKLVSPAGNELKTTRSITLKRR